MTEVMMVMHTPGNIIHDGGDEGHVPLLYDLLSPGNIIHDGGDDGHAHTWEYRVAAINPEHFQSFTVPLKIKFLKKFFFPKPSQLSAEE